MYFTGVFDADCGILYEILENIYFYSGSERQRMIHHRNDGSMGSMLYGYTWKGYLKRAPDGSLVYRTKAPYPGLYKTKCMDDYPELEYVFKEFQELYFKDFFYTSIQCNKNFKCPRHIDSRNVGESILLCLGDYSGGELVIEDSETGNDLVIDNRNNMYKFNGSKHYHYVNDFEGTRYSLVWFSNDKVKKKMLESQKS